MSWLILICYFFAAFGACNVIAFGEGPWGIFEKIRNVAYNHWPRMYRMLTCMMCLPANFGWVFSLFNWFVIPSIPLTPFNIILAGTTYWFIAIIMDAVITSGVVWLISRVDDALERPDNNEGNKQILND